MTALTQVWGRSSWFGGPNDPSAGGTPASGLPITDPGIAVYNRATLGGWWAIKAPNGNIGLVKQTDVGPAPTTGRKFDYTYSLLPLFGYSQQNFPTGGQTYGIYLGKDIGATSFARNFGAALGKLGATPTQSSTLIQSLDAGAIVQGHTAVVATTTGKPGQTNTAAGQAPSTSEAVPSNIIPSPDIGGTLTNLFNGLVNDAKYAGVMIGVLLLGAMMIFRAFSSGSSRRPVPVPV